MDDKTDNNFKIHKSKEIKTISHHTGVVEKIILLKDGRLAFSFYGRLASILIYNTDNYSIDLKNDKINKRIIDLMQTKNGNIIASLSWGFILVTKVTSTSYEIIQKIKAHDKAVKKTIEIKDRRLISCAEDKKMKIWKYFNNQYILENILCLKKSKKILEKEAILEERALRLCCCCFEMPNIYRKFYSIDDILELKNNIIVSTQNGNDPIIFGILKN